MVDKIIKIMSILMIINFLLWLHYGCFLKPKNIHSEDYYRTSCLENAKQPKRIK
jgi:hypothetical protein